MNDALANADAAQRHASDPTASVFVAASAGSGKTKLLTDRVLRLMLGGADPGRILCLTFTRAAAAEMAVRLQRRLGEWAALPDAALDARLAALDVPADAAARRRARALFAIVLDLPGGMRIQTIHAFCQSLLRRFPLEAQISPHFELLGDADKALAFTEAREQALTEAVLPSDRAALATLAGLISADAFGDLVQQLAGRADLLVPALALAPEALRAALCRTAGTEADSEDALVVAACTWKQEVAFAESLRGIAARGSASFAAKASRMLDWLSQPTALRVTHWAAWREEFIAATGKRAPGAFCNKKLVDTESDLLEACLAEQARVQAVDDALTALRAAEATAALLTLAGPVIRLFRDRKESAGLLDYDDLIGRTARVLHDPGAAWVLYKLDGGIDHLLLDEVQDTADAQWRIADALTAEFFAGEGAREAERTVFAVGDAKQSIFSFQGAEPEALARWREKWRQRTEAAGSLWRETPLETSFRSTAPVLALVDAVFADPRAAMGVTEPGLLRHQASRAGHAGRVELWPLVPAPAADPAADAVATENRTRQTGPQILARHLADWIAAETAGSTMLESRGRALAPGDVLVLLRRRLPFAPLLVRALKARGVPVAGLDRMLLTEQIAVADLLALCDALLLPDDDLTLAVVLKSPLGGIDEDGLMALAPDRPGTLWEALRRRAVEREDWQAAHDFLTALLRRVDYVTPHALLCEALGPLGGRARLLGRLGAEAAEPIDELLNAALEHARLNPPSLQHFVHWLRRSGAEVKREAEGAGGAVRVMTVHGAKGLQAPLVILPDTTAQPDQRDRLVWTTDPATGIALPLWVPAKEFEADAARGLKQQAKARTMAEHNRLLYVALTRAEDRLIVCGWQPHRAAAEAWYPLVEAGFRRAGSTSMPFDAWAGERLLLESPQLAPPLMTSAAQSMPSPQLPAWAGAAPGWRPAPLPPEPALPTPLTPSRPEGVEHGPAPAAASPLDGAADRFRRGRLTHALLQHLPDLPPTRWEAAARAFLARQAPADLAAAILAETLAVLAHPVLAPLFGPAGRPEVPLTGVVAGRVIGGMIDRLAVLEDRVLLADYKTGRAAPARPEDTPVAYLRQMAAYRALLAAIHPGRKVVASLVWTRDAQITVLPDALLDAHAPHAAPATPPA